MKIEFSSRKLINQENADKLLRRADRLLLACNPTRNISSSIYSFYYGLVKPPEELHSTDDLEEDVNISRDTLESYVTLASYIDDLRSLLFTLREIRKTKSFRFDESYIIDEMTTKFNKIFSKISSPRTVLLMLESEEFWKDFNEISKNKNHKSYLIEELVESYLFGDYGSQRSTKKNVRHRKSAMLRDKVSYDFSVDEYDFSFNSQKENEEKKKKSTSGTSQIETHADESIKTSDTSQSSASLKVDVTIDLHDNKESPEMIVNLEEKILDSAVSVNNPELPQESNTPQHDPILALRKTDEDVNDKIIKAETKNTIKLPSILLTSKDPFGSSYLKTSKSSERLGNARSLSTTSKGSKGLSKEKQRKISKDNRPKYSISDEEIITNKATKKISKLAHSTCSFDKGVSFNENSTRDKKSRSPSCFRVNRKKVDPSSKQIGPLFRGKKKRKPIYRAQSKLEI